MARFRYDGREFELISPTVGEARWAERQIGSGLSAWTDTEKMFALAMLSLRRRDVMVTWADMDGMELDAIEILDDEATDEDESDGDVVPTEAGPEAGDQNEPSDNDAMSTSST